MTVLAIRDLTLRIAGRALLEGADLVVDPGARSGWSGGNGARQVDAAEGHHRRHPARWRRDPPRPRARLGPCGAGGAGGPESLLETVLAADTERATLLAEVEAGAEPHRMAEIHERLIAIQADSAPSRAATILAGLGFDAAAQARPTTDSPAAGGCAWPSPACSSSSRSCCCSTSRPTTSTSRRRCGSRAGCSASPGAAIIVSHDRGLLERCVDAIAHLDRGKLTLYPGAFDNFVRVRTERQAQQAAMNEKLAAERAHIQSFVDRFRAKASKARQAQSRIKALERMPAIESVVEDHVTRFAFPEPAELAPPVLSISGGSIGYDGRVVLRGLDLRLDQDDRIALLGANGNGKSTLAKLFAGRLSLMGGREFRSPKLKIGYFAQHQTDELDMEGTPLSHMQAAMPRATVTQCRSQLARFGLDVERATTRISACSGGEKARLLLALCTREAPQLLILDEPTNHLDIDARDALVKALADYNGAVILISHDPHLVELVADRLWLVGEGKVSPFDGDLDDYRALLGGGRRAARSEPAGAARPSERRGRAESRTALAPLRDRLKQIEAQIAKLQDEAAVIDKALADPRLYAGNKTDLINRATTRRAVINKILPGLESEWLELQEKLEAA
jgi:ATP-binding cassette subfamily F protein 3